MGLSKKEMSIFKSIFVASENDPKRPEFPSNNPKFPATPIYKIKIPGFSNVYLKDESYNPTGTHKDRMAWEIIVTYRNFLLAKKRGQIKFNLPSMSLISSGSAAIAIQAQLKKHSLPNLKVLVDKNLDQEIISAMKKAGCIIYQKDLGKTALSWNKILAMTDNKDGFDITSSEALDPTTRFYDWLSYEIINFSPEYCFIPFGSGNLFENILNITKREVSGNHHDPRFSGKPEILRRCNFFGATSNNPKTRADKLYCPYRPFVHFNDQWIKFYQYSGFCGLQSNVYPIKERFLDMAMDLAKSQNINCEPSGISGLALFLQMKNKIPKNKKILIVNTGKSKYE